MRAWNDLTPDERLAAFEALDPGISPILAEFKRLTAVRLVKNADGKTYAPEGWNDFMAAHGMRMVKTMQTVSKMTFEDAK